MKIPEFKANKNGYEIRTDILNMAQTIVLEEYHAKFNGWEITQYRDANTGNIVSQVQMPEFPGLDKILETAERMYNFVNQSMKSKSQ